MRSLAFYRYAVPMALRNLRLRVQVWAIWYGGGILRGRWPWETHRELRETQRKIRAATDPLFAEIEKQVLGQTTERP